MIEFATGTPTFLTCAEHSSSFPKIVQTEQRLLWSLDWPWPGSVCTGGVGWAEGVGVNFTHHSSGGKARFSAFLFVFINSVGPPPSLPPPNLQSDLPQTLEHSLTQPQAPNSSG